jgi:hypothetical protein
MTDERPGFLDTLKAFCAVTAALFVGGLMIWGPEDVIEDIRKEMSDTMRVAVGAGAIGFGVLFGVTVLFARDRGARSQAIAARLKGALLACIMALVLWAILARTGVEVATAWRLKDGAGRATRAQVQGRTGVVFHRQRPRSATLRYDGHTREVRLPEDVRGSATVPVLYLPDEPAVVMVGERDDSFLALLDRNLGPWAKWGRAAGTLVVVLVLLAGLKRFLLG